MEQTKRNDDVDVEVVVDNDLMVAPRLYPTQSKFNSEVVKKM